MTSAKTPLPMAYISRMKDYLPTDFDSFFAGCSAPSTAGIRLNTNKVSRRDLPFSLRQIPWAENGFYTDKDAVSGHPYFFAGCYYIQEPSAMYPASILPVCPGDLVLDLCAAPGGKATELSLHLQGEGLLIANDVSASRSRALLKNLTLWGAPNTCISAETPQKLADQFGCCFDKILVDAPCSGEGMFRRDSHMIRSWQTRGPSEYVPLQREILSAAVRMLKPGGYLVYSTCTFSEEEDEDVVSWILKRCPDLTLVQPRRFDGFSPGRGDAPLDCCVRLYPHRIEGEGQFAALLRKTSSASPDSSSLAVCSEEEIQKSREEMPAAVRSFLSRLPEDFLSGYRYEQIGELCLLVPPYRLPSLRFLRTGVAVGTIHNGRFAPSQDLALLLGPGSFDSVLDLPASDPRVIRYLKGETIGISPSERSMLTGAGGGWVLFCADAHSLGWAKVAKETLKNKLEPGWRMQ